MRRFSLLAALAASGCLYTDPINQRPVIDQMAASPQPTRYDQDVTVAFDVYDPDGDDFSVNARVLEVPLVVAGQYDLQFMPSNGPGQYTVVVSATDSLGASSGERRIVIDVPNMTPKVTPPDRLGADAAPVADVYPLGTTFTIPAPTIDDEDKNLSADLWVNGTKLQDTDHKQFRALMPGPYTVTYKVTDTLGAIGMASLSVTVADDRWPCVGGTSPDASTQVLLTVIGETRRLLVTRVDDDLNPWPTDSHGGHAYFQWLINSGDGNYRVIPNWTESYFDLDTIGYVVGDSVQVRVVVSDDDATHVPICTDPTMRVCQTPIGCPDWVTWNLEFFQ
jgi:hypothetical protein